MRKMKNRLSILIAVLVMVSITGTSVLAYAEEPDAELRSSEFLKSSPELRLEEDHQHDDTGIQNLLDQPVDHIQL